MCHKSQVTCHVSHVIIFFSSFFSQCCEASQWRVFYQEGLPCLVSSSKGRNIEIFMPFRIPKKAMSFDLSGIRNSSESSLRNRFWPTQNNSQTILRRFELLSNLISEQIKICFYMQQSVLQNQQHKI